MAMLNDKSVIGASHGLQNAMAYPRQKGQPAPAMTKPSRSLSKAREACAVLAILRIRFLDVGNILVYHGLSWFITLYSYALSVAT